MNTETIYLYRGREVRFLKDLLPRYPEGYVLMQFVNGGAVVVSAETEITAKEGK